MPTERPVVRERKRENHGREALEAAVEAARARMRVAMVALQETNYIQPTTIADKVQLVELIQTHRLTLQSAIAKLEAAEAGLKRFDMQEKTTDAEPVGPFYADEHDVSSVDEQVEVKLEPVPPALTKSTQEARADLVEAIDKFSAAHKTEVESIWGKLGDTAARHAALEAKHEEFKAAHEQFPAALSEELEKVKAELADLQHKAEKTMSREAIELLIQERIAAVGPTKLTAREEFELHRETTTRDLRGPEAKEGTEDERGLTEVIRQLATHMKELMEATHKRGEGDIDSKDYFDSIDLLCRKLAKRNGNVVPLLNEVIPREEVDSPHSVDYPKLDEIGRGLLSAYYHALFAAVYEAGDYDPAVFPKDSINRLAVRFAETALKESHKEGGLVDALYDEKEGLTDTLRFFMVQRGTKRINMPINKWLTRVMLGKRDAAYDEAERRFLRKVKELAKKLPPYPAPGLEIKNPNQV